MPTTLRQRFRVTGNLSLRVKTATGKKFFGVVAQLIERYVRIVEVVGLSPISSTNKFSGIWRNGRR